MSSFSVVNRYVKAVLSEFSGENLDRFIKDINELSKAFIDDKFMLVLTYPKVKLSDKTNFILSLISDSDVRIRNFIKLLGKNNRLILIPEIAKELNYQKSLIDNVFYGVIKSNFDISQDQKSKLEAKLSHKFGAKILLNYKQENYNGIKVEIDGLGIETGFSIDSLKTKITQYILKAI